jgi:TRAP-type transport system small permease protein
MLTQMNLGNLKRGGLMTVQVVSKSFFRVFEKVMRFISGLLLAVMVIIVFSNVVARYGLNSSLAWSEEISRIIFIYIVFFGAILAYIKDEHLGVDLLVKKLPLKASHVVMIVSDLLVLYAIYLLAWGGLDLTRQSLQSGWTSPALSIPYGYVYMIVPVCSLVLFIQAVIKLIQNIRSLVAAFKGGN